jgi:predicted Kef-type K+ transport protein
MDTIAIIIAFALSFAARQVDLPPLVGYLVAGFAIKASGIQVGTLIVDWQKRASCCCCSASG